MRNWINIVESTGPVVYHGSPVPLTHLRVNGDGMFFTASKSSAEAYARSEEGAIDGVPGELISARIHMNNPLIVTNDWLVQFAQANHDALEQAREESGSSLEFDEAFEDSEAWARNPVFAEAHRAGHDGVVIERDLLPVESLGGDWDYFTSYAVFDPTHVQVISREPVEID